MEIKVNTKISMLKFPQGYGLGYGQRINKGEEGFKSPLLVVGCNAYAREHCKGEVFKAWDLYILFFPTPEPVYRVGILYISRTDNNAVMLNVCEGTDVEITLKQALKAPNEVIE